MIMMSSDDSSTVMEEKGSDDEPKTPDFPKKTKTSYDVIIIGAGPAGYTAGIYCSRARRDTLLISGLLPGGQLMNTTDVENYPGFDEGIMGPDLMITMRKQAERMNTTIMDDVVVNVDFRAKPFKVLTGSEEYEAKAVIVCTGATPRKIGIEGEQTFSGKGVSYCATCDGAFFRNQDIAVVGGGDSCMEEATFLTKFASKVHIIHRRDTFRASKIMQERALSNEKIEVHWNSAVEDIKGDQKVQQIILKDTKTGENKTLEMGGVFVAIGHEPNTELFKNQLEMDENGYIIQKDNTETSVKGVFTAGDVHDHRYRQAVTAAGFGCMSAIDVDKYLSEQK
jgi:thioredoxin reductase (NADPH)